MTGNRCHFVQRRKVGKGILALKSRNGQSQATGRAAHASSWAAQQRWAPGDCSQEAPARSEPLSNVGAKMLKVIIPGPPPEAGFST